VKFVLGTCASAKEPWSTEAEKVYLKKITPLIGFEIKKLQGKKSDRENQQQKRKSDSDLLLKEIKEDDYVILFDEKGEVMDSPRFSQKINQCLQSGKKRVLFVIGGAYGVDERVQARAQQKTSLSKMVFNHLVAQTVVMEQIYRAFAILKNLPYHNE